MTSKAFSPGEPVIGGIFITRQSSRARLASGLEDSVDPTRIELLELVLADFGVFIQPIVNRGQKKPIGSHDNLSGMVIVTVSAEMTVAAGLFPLLQGGNYKHQIW
jgi:hypothetical protein